MSSPPTPPMPLFRAIVDAYRTRASEHEELMSHVEGSLKRIQKDCGAVHSYRARMKDPTHLRDKLERRWNRLVLEEDKEFDVTADNLSEKINDLVGARILHLHTTQFSEIHRAITHTIGGKCRLLNSGPEAKVWDPEYKKLFSKLDIRCVETNSLYTSVHYEYEWPGRAPCPTFEIQVRTLAEELWGEADHLINYPNKSKVDSCKEQILVLARATSTCTRLVDSIMRAHDLGRRRPKKGKEKSSTGK